jgi:predicted AAA+ superfamily ATPase
MYFERMLTPRLDLLFKTFPAVVVSGARQVGKSTLIEHFIGHQADIVVFDPVIDVENARKDPELFLNNHRTPLVLDEIQYAAELVPSVKRSIDRNRAPGQYLITGSQQWGVLKSIAESLAGRAVFLDLEGFTLAEIARSTSQRPWLAAWLEDPTSFLELRPERLVLEATLYEQLWRGWLPEAQLLPCDSVRQLSESDYAVPWDLVLTPTPDK